MSLLRTKSSDTPLERRRTTRATAFVNAHGYRVEVLDHRQVAVHRDEWLSLAARSIEPNVFFDPDFMLPAARYLSGNSPRFVIVRRFVEGRLQIVGLCPINQKDIWSWRRTIRVWRHPYTALGTPLFDRRCFKGAFDAMLDWLAHSGRSALLVPDLRIDRPFARMVVGRARRIGSLVSTFDVHERPILQAGGGERRPSANTRKSIVRSRAKLDELGTTRFHATRSADEIADAILWFLSLEARGWKGSRGTALENDPKTKDFALNAANALAERGSCFLGSLEHRGKPIAMLIAFGEQDHLVCWKMTYDESFARYSPGLLLLASITDAWRAEPNFAFADSCTAPDNAMVLRLWKDRIRVGDLLVAVSPRQLAFRIANGHERVRRFVRRSAKTVYHAALGRRRR